MVICTALPFVADDGSLNVISVVVLAVEGGLNTLRSVQHSVSRGIPAVLVQGSGRMTDVLAFACQVSEVVAGTDG